MDPLPTSHMVDTNLDFGLDSNFIVGEYPPNIEELCRLFLDIPATRLCDLTIKGIQDKVNKFYGV